MGDPRAAPVGRDRELASLAAGLDAHRDGPVVVVSGPAGIGKSALLAEAGNRAAAAAAGALVLAGAATEFEAGVGLAVLTVALSPLVVALTGDDRRRPGADLAALRPAGTACGSDGGVAPPPAAGAGRGLGDDRYRLARAVAALLRRAAADRPVLLVLEDVHWADPATVEVVVHLLRGRVPGLVLVLSHRTGLLDPGLRRALAATVRPDVDLRLELGPLPRAAADALLGTAVAPARRAQLYAGSGGNPFHLLALARHDRGDGPLPATVVDVLRAEIVALAAPVRQLLEGAAVVGDPFDAGSAAAAAGLPAFEDAVDALVAVDLVRVTAHPHRFAFRHPLVRRAVYELTGPQRRAAAHSRLDAAITAAGGSVVDRAPHVAASAHRGDTDATAVLGEAASLVSARSPATAARWLRAALDLLTPAAPERPGLLLALAKALRTSGRLTQSRATLDELAALLPDGPGRADVLTLAANLDHLLGRHAEAGVLLTSALAALPDRRSPAAARLLLALCSVGMHTCDYRWMRETAAEATVIARTLGDRRCSRRPSPGSPRPSTTWRTSRQGAPRAPRWRGSSRGSTSGRSPGEWTPSHGWAGRSGSSSSSRRRSTRSPSGATSPAAVGSASCCRSCWPAGRSPCCTAGDWARRPTRPPTRVTPPS